MCKVTAVILHGVVSPDSWHRLLSRFSEAFRFEVCGGEILACGATGFRVKKVGVFACNAQRACVFNTLHGVSNTLHGVSNTLYSVFNTLEGVSITLGADAAKFRASSSSHYVILSIQVLEGL